MILAFRPCSATLRKQINLHSTDNQLAIYWQPMDNLRAIYGQSTGNLLAIDWQSTD